MNAAYETEKGSFIFGESVLEDEVCYTSEADPFAWRTEKAKSLKRDVDTHLHAKDRWVMHG
jgi:hypothetical protein